VRGDKNLLFNCSASHNGSKGFIIEIGDGNKIWNSSAIANCRDGIEIQGGSYNRIISNLVEDNGNETTCDSFEEDYKPCFYAGIDILSGSEYNEIKNNHACGNLGCISSEETICEVRERNYWDEDPGSEGNCCYNEWENNTVCPECYPGPPD
jgi:hypothetical protein